MRTKAVIFSCLKHIRAARIAAEAASRFFDVIIAIDGNEDEAEMSECFIKTKFPRGGNLNGIGACKGIAETLLAHSQNGYVVKLDSDTVIKESACFDGYDIAGFTHPYRPPSVLGACYGISARSLEHVIKRVDMAKDFGVTSFPEDAIITSYAQTLAKDDFKSNIMPLSKLGVWHPKIAPVLKHRIANFGIYRIKGDWCHDESLAAMSHYLNS